MIGNSGNIYFQEMMNRYNEMYAYMSASSNARWAAMQAQLRLEEALRRAEVAKDYRDMTAARQKAQTLKQGIQENARNAGLQTVLGIVGNVNDGVSGVTTGLSYNAQNGNKLYIGTLKPSPAYGFRVYAKPTIQGIVGSSLAKSSTYLTIAVSAATVAGTYAEEGYLGQRTAIATGEAVGGGLGAWGGAVLGAKVGAGIGVWFGGVGAGPGALIGGAIGGAIGGVIGGTMGGSLGGSTIKYFY